IKFTEKGEIILKISILSQKAIHETKGSPSYDQMNTKEVLLFELYDTGIGMNPEYVQHAWKSFSQGDMSITKKQDGTGLGLSICKSLVEMNGGVIKVESQLGKGSKFWFTWNVESLTASMISKFPTSSLLKTQLQLSYVLPNVIRQKRILIIHQIESMRNAMLKYLKGAKKVDAFDLFDKGIKAARTCKELYNRPAYDIAFINLYENNEEEVMKVALELRGLEMNSNNLVIIFIVFPTNEGILLAKRLISKVGGATSVIYTPITWKKLIKQFMDIEKNEATNKNNTNLHSHENESGSILKRIADYGFYEVGNANQEIFEGITRKDSISKCILCVDDNPIGLEKVSKLGYLTISATNGQEAVKLIDSEFNSDIEQIKSHRISLILTECNLPIMSCFDISRVIRAMRPPISNIPIIVLTSFAMEEIQGKCIESGINDYLAKPLKIEELKQVLNKWIGEN
ncbi:22070_t:CDS:2, partial [Racocetra persica]